MPVWPGMMLSVLLTWAVSARDQQQVAKPLFPVSGVVYLAIPVTRGWEFPSLLPHQ